MSVGRIAAEIPEGRALGGAEEEAEAPVLIVSRGVVARRGAQDSRTEVGLTVHSPALGQHGAEAQQVLQIAEETGVGRDAVLEAGILVMDDTLEALTAAQILGLGDAVLRWIDGRVLQVLEAQGACHLAGQ